MKIVLTTPSGSRLEAEGTVEECAALVAAMPRAPTLAPSPYWIIPQSEPAVPYYTPYVPDVIITCSGVAGHAHTS